MLKNTGKHRWLEARAVKPATIPASPLPGNPRTHMRPAQSLLSPRAKVRRWGEEEFLWREGKTSLPGVAAGNRPERAVLFPLIPGCGASELLHLILIDSDLARFLHLIAEVRDKD